MWKGFRIVAVSRHQLVADLRLTRTLNPVWKFFDLLNSLGNHENQMAWNPAQGSPRCTVMDLMGYK